MEKRKYCSVPRSTPRRLSHVINPKRAEIIFRLVKKWVNGTKLEFYFFDNDQDGGYLENSNEWITWKGTDRQKDKVREGFKIWENIDIGLSFNEVFTPQEAKIRIGFMQGDGSWSYVGRDIVDADLGINERTMNFGWNIDTTDRHNGMDTVLHEIGHTLGFEHEHQNHSAGIEWDEAAVYQYFSGEPNFWCPNKTYENVLKKLESTETKGTTWDPDSIMEYPFEPLLIKKPEKYYINGLTPAGGLSKLDISFARKLYPPQQSKRISLTPLQSISLEILNSEQQDFDFEPIEDGYYTLRAFGKIDAVIVLYVEEDDGKLKYLSADDNGGIDKEVQIKWKMFKGRKYVLKLRLYYKNADEKFSIMIWK